MQSCPQVNDAASVWDVVRPSGPSRVRGRSMAGFRDRGIGTVDLPLVPSPAVTLVLEFGDGSLTVGGATGDRTRGSLVAGLDPGAIRMLGKDIKCVEVRLSPVVAYAALGVSPAELAHEVVTLDDVWGREAGRIGQQLTEIPSWEDRFGMTEALLAGRSQERQFVEPQVAWVWNQIVLTRGRVRIEDLAVDIGWSRKRLWSRFRSQIGLAPKRAAMLVRFDHAAHRLAAGDGPARVAAECGYVDQSHFHREVAAFTAMTPSALAGAPGLVFDDGPSATPGTFVQDPRR